ncbi:MAG TPA: pyruvate ferredoxin oxidoreductase [Syntrophobacteraceae bacterium]|nr:pyruvate ferredoxin oxidoreductase [Syntrophobacteraceae bacterium]
MKRVLEGSHAVAEAVRLARVQVISAYPITPQTHIVEYLSELCASGALPARFLRVESEHSAMAALIGAASSGVRTFTATSSQGLALMHELLHWASGARLPIVMAEVNRALAPGWNIWTEQTDSLAQRDTGWVQLYCEDSQEALDSTLFAFRLAEQVSLPVMVVLDAFYLSHTYEPVDVPGEEEADAFLPAFQPKFQLDPANPCAFNQLAPPNVYMEMRYSIQMAMAEVLNQYDAIENEFAQYFGRRYGVLEEINCTDARIILVTSGTITSTARLVVDELRARGELVGLVKMKLFRPFPAQEVMRVLAGAEKVAVIDRNFSFGASGIFAQELRAALCNLARRPMVFGYVAGLGGRDVTTDVIEDIYWRTARSTDAQPQDVWIGLQEVSS